MKPITFSKTLSNLLYYVDENITHGVDEVVFKDWSHFFGSLFGFFIGDALGVPYEFCDQNEIKDVKFKGFGTHNQPPGFWSDDSALVLATINSIVSNSGVSFTKLAFEMSKVLKGNYFPLNKLFDIGVSTSNALSQYEQAFEKRKKYIFDLYGDDHEFSCGNGSLMRMLPIYWYLKRTGMSLKRNLTYQLIKILSSITHKHIVVIEGCFVGFILFETIYDNLEKELDEIYNIFKKRVAAYFDNRELNIDIVIKYMSIIYPGNIKAPKNPSGFIVDTLEAVIYSFFNSNSYESAVKNAVKLGGDTDTNAAITGGLAGLYYGFHSIPNEWIEELHGKRQLIKLSYNFWQFLKKFEGGGEL